MPGSSRSRAGSPGSSPTGSGVPNDPVRWLVGRPQAVAAGSLAAIAGLAWAYLLAGAGMDMEAGSAGPGVHGGSFLVVFGMWAAMMLAMMLPSAAPMILLYGAVAGRTSGSPSIGFFASGYALVWTGFSVGAAGLQLALHEAMLLSPGLRVTGAALGGVVLVAAGLYQLTPLKHACLRRCRSPVAFITRHWRPGAGGALRMGLVHGLYCVGCCWALMALLFVGGVMHLLWVAVIALAVLVEKVAPAGHAVARAAGVVLTVWGAGVIWHVLA